MFLHSDSHSLLKITKAGVSKQEQGGGKRGSQPCIRDREGPSPEASPRCCAARYCARDDTHMLQSLHGCPGKDKGGEWSPKAPHPGSSGCGYTGPSPETHPSLQLPLSSPRTYLTSPQMEGRSWVSREEKWLDSSKLHRSGDSRLGTLQRLLPLQPATPLVLKAPSATPVPFPRRVWPCSGWNRRGGGGRTSSLSAPSFPWRCSGGSCKPPPTAMSQSRDAAYLAVAHDQSAEQQARPRESHGGEAGAPGSGLRGKEKSGRSRGARSAPGGSRQRRVVPLGHLRGEPAVGSPPRGSAPPGPAPQGTRGHAERSRRAAGQRAGEGTPQERGAHPPAAAGAAALTGSGAGRAARTGGRGATRRVLGSGLPAVRLPRGAGCILRPAQGLAPPRPGSSRPLPSPPLPGSPPPGP